ncbi:MAG TPA: ESX-1 secretion-associated protein [Mycobacterium sp.]|nr:ESX-1 secretion-associated protein [Mycobacterium sp.]
MGTVSVDPASLRMAAQRLEAAAEILAGAVGTHLRGLQYGAAAGPIVADVGQWSRAAREVAAALRCGADRYCEGETAAVAALR